jgi:cytosine/adenosine deaminase-related metal-dependent hydrolase
MTGTNHVLRRCRLRDVDQLRDVYLADGKVAGVDAAHDRSSWGPTDVDVAGRVVLPGLVDAHVHLDKAYLLPQLEDRGAFAGGGVASAIAATKALRDELGLEAFRPGMERLVRSMTAQGIVAARAHVEVDTDIDPAIVGLHREVLAGHPRDPSAARRLSAERDFARSERALLDGTRPGRRLHCGWWLSIRRSRPIGAPGPRLWFGRRPQSAR